MDSNFLKGVQPSPAATAAPRVRNGDSNALDKNVYGLSGNNINGMHELIPVVNRLQDVFSKAGLPISMDLPQIVVVGSQSVGKSSVLESFVGHEFLPRGEGIVTRRPLVIQMVTDAEAEYCEFAHEAAPRRKYTDFQAVREEIINETARLAPGKTISPMPINLCIHSPDVLNLTVVDLPGLTQANIGDQPAGIQNQIRQVVMQYAKPENALILAVSEGNTDLANSAALNIAQEVDPEGVRTISVITKLDLMVKGRDARSILTNKLCPLRLGHVGVVNSNHEDKSLDLRTARKAERDFFRAHPAYHDIANQCGTPFLQAVLNVQLCEHIRQHLPRLHDTLRQQLTAIQPLAEKFQKYDMTDDATLQSRQSKELISLVQQLASSFERAMESSSNLPDTDDQHALTNALDGGAVINKIYYGTFPNEMQPVETFQNDNYKREIAYAINNIYGIRLGIFAPQKAFYMVARKRIAKMRDPSAKCLTDVVREISQTFLRILDGSKIRYPALRGAILHMFECYLNERQKKTMEYIDLFIDCHESYMNTNHKDFPSAAEIFKAKPTNNGTEQQANPKDAQPDKPVVSNLAIRICDKNFVAATRKVSINP